MSIRAEHLNHIYGEGTAFEQYALKDVSFEIEDGQFIGLIGHTGSGKSTLIQHLNGLLRASSGAIYYNGENIYQDGYDMKALRSKVGLVFQYPEHQLFEVDVFSDVCFGPKNQGLSKEEVEERAREALTQVGLDEKLWQQSPFELSGGQKRRVAIAGVMAMHPGVLILDEPTAGLDPRTHLEFRQMVWELHEQGKTILLSSHNLAELSELCTDIGIIDAGKMVLSGSMDEIMERIYTSKQIIISVQDQMEKALAFLKESPMVRTISICEKDIMVGFTGDERRESELLKQMIEAGIPVRGFMREPGSLESIFMQITDHNKEKVVLSYEDESGL